MASISIYLDKRRAKSDGTYPIKLNISINSRGNIMMPLKYSVFQTHWKNGKVTDRADKNIINTEIAKVYNMVALELRQLELDGSVHRLSAEEIKRRLWVWGDKNSAYTVQKHFEEFIRSKRKDSTKETYKYTAIKIESFDIRSVPYVKQACEAQRWAFAGDYIHLWALYHHGGIYLNCQLP